MQRSLFLLLLPPALLLGPGCGSDTPTTRFDPHDLGRLSSWGRGIEGFVVTPPEDTADSGGGGSDAFDGQWTGTYSFSAYLPDIATTCTCSAPLTLVIEEGSLAVGFGETCSMDCGINSQLHFDGTVDSAGVATGTVEESTSFYFTAPWTGSFTATAGSGSFSEAGVSTSQGTADLSGSFSVTPAP